MKVVETLATAFERTVGYFSNLNFSHTNVWTLPPLETMNLPGMSHIYISLLRCFLYLLMKNTDVQYFHHWWHFCQFLIVINITARHEKGILGVWISTWPVIPECDLDFCYCLCLHCSLYKEETGTFSRWVLLHQTVHKIPFPNMLACTPIEYHHYKTLNIEKLV